MGRRGWLAFSLLALGVLLLDQVTKTIMTATLAPRGAVRVIPGLLDLTYVQNRGAVFGLFRNLPEPWRLVFLTLVPLAAVVFVILMAYRTPAGRLRPLVGLGMILGGAMGNLADRFRLGAVVDFLDFHLAGYHWPAFNMADSAICVGVGLLVLEMFLAPEPSGSGNADSAPSAASSGRE